MSDETLGGGWRHDHTCSDDCAATEEHMHAMDLDAWRQIAEAGVDDSDGGRLSARDELDLHMLTTHGRLLGEPWPD